MGMCVDLAITLENVIVGSLKLSGLLSYAKIFLRMESHVHVALFFSHLFMTPIPNILVTWTIRTSPLFHACQIFLDLI